MIPIPSTKARRKPGGALRGSIPVSKCVPVVIRAWLGVGLVSASIGPLACGGGDFHEGAAVDPETARTAWCASACEYWKRCDGATGSGCYSYCRAANAGYLAALRPEYLSGSAPCIKSVACQSDAFSRCWNSTAPTLDPLAETTAFCQAMAPRFFACYYRADIAECIADFSPWAGAALQRASACSSAACDQIDSCLQDALLGRSSS
jgi:hypothetical protein